VFKSIRVKLFAVFLGFLLLGVGSVTATLLSVRAQRADARVINLAGRQRMLTQAMTKATLGIAGDAAADYRAELSEAAHLFERTLTALRDGGSAPYGGETITLPPTTDPDIRSQLAEVVTLWGQFRQKVNAVQIAEPGDAAFLQAVAEIESLTPVMLQEMDQVVQLYEAAAERKLTRLYAIQAVFFVSALALLAWGYLLIQRTVINPVITLEAASRNIAAGDLATPIHLDPAAGAELGLLARSFDDMRQELAASQLELKRWADELETRVVHRTREMVALFEISAEITSQLNIQQILESIVDKARQLAGGEVAALCLLDPTRGGLTATSTSGPAEAFVRTAFEDTEEAELEIIRARETISQHEGCDCHFLRSRFRRSHLAVPLRAGDRVLGVLCVGHREEGCFDEEGGRLLSLLANSGAIALENARLYQQLEQEAALAERERIVAEIHDGLAQTLSFLNLRLGAVEGLIEDEEIAHVTEQLALMRRTVERTGKEVRRLMKDMQSSVHAYRTLEERLRQVTKRFVEERGMTVELNVETRRPLREPPEISEQVTRVMQEALTNVHKHAPYSPVTVTLEQRDREAMLCVQDEGPGFDTETLIEREGHFGLKVMAARAKRIDGELEVKSAPGRGTTVTLHWSITEG